MHNTQQRKEVSKYQIGSPVSCVPRRGAKTRRNGYIRVFNFDAEEIGVEVDGYEHLLWFHTHEIQPRRARKSPVGMATLPETNRRTQVRLLGAPDLNWGTQRVNR